MEEICIYNPCVECFIRRGTAYSDACTDTCEYANYVSVTNKLLEDVQKHLEETNKKLDRAYQVIGEIIDKW